jgi:hypothetical protein
MAIKRPTKSRGTPSHKPVASAPLRHVDVRAPQQMVPGEVYVGLDWLPLSRRSLVAVHWSARVMKLAAFTSIRNGHKK